jgi:hypothetical protein
MFHIKAFPMKALFSSHMQFWENVQIDIAPVVVPAEKPYENAQ